MTIINILWWALFMILGLIAESILPGIDILLIGVIIALQEGKIVQILWVLLVSILLQEGIGTLAFGSSILSYTTAILVFYGGRALLEQENIMFVLVVAVSAGLGHYVFTQAMATLQGISMPGERLLLESCVQVLILPPLWSLTRALRKKMVPHAENRTGN